MCKASELLVLNAYALLICFFVNSKRGPKQNPRTKTIIPGLIAFGAGVKMAETLEGRESPSSGTPEIFQKWSRNLSEIFHSIRNFGLDLFVDLFVCLFAVLVICNVSHSFNPRRQELGTIWLNTLTFPYRTFLSYPGKGITFPSWMIKDGRGLESSGTRKCFF